MFKYHIVISDVGIIENKQPMYFNEMFVKFSNAVIQQRLGHINSSNEFIKYTLANGFDLVSYVKDFNKVVSIDNPNNALICKYDYRAQIFQFDNDSISFYFNYPSKYISIINKDETSYTLAKAIKINKLSEIDQYIKDNMSSYIYTDRQIDESTKESLDVINDKLREKLKMADKVSMEIKPSRSGSTYGSEDKSMSIRTTKFTPSNPINKIIQDMRDKEQATAEN